MMRWWLWVQFCPKNSNSASHGLEQPPPVVHGVTSHPSFHPCSFILRTSTCSRTILLAGDRRTFSSTTRAPTHFLATFSYDVQPMPASTIEAAGRGGNLIGNFRHLCLPLSVVSQEPRGRYALGWVATSSFQNPVPRSNDISNRFRARASKLTFYNIAQSSPTLLNIHHDSTQAPID